MIWSKKVLIAAKRMRGTQSKIHSTSAKVVSLGLISYSKVKAATFAQEGNNGATSKGRTGEISNYNEGVATKIVFSTST